MSIYKQRVLELRRLMKENNIDAYLNLKRGSSFERIFTRILQKQSLYQWL